MKGGQGVYLLGAAFVAGLVSAFAAPEGFDVLFAVGVFSGMVGLAALVYAVLLACSAVAPYPQLGRSPAGQAMQGTASLLMCAMLLAGRSWSPVVGWCVAISYFLLFMIGLRLEHKAREHRHAI